MIIWRYITMKQPGLIRHPVGRRNMDQNYDAEIEEEREETESMGRNRKKPGSAFPWHMIITIILMIVLMVVFMLFFRGGGRISNEDISAILGRFDQLNRKLPQYAEIEKRIAQLEIRIKGVQQSISKVEANGASLRKELGKIYNQIGLLKTDISTKPKVSKAPEPVQKKPVSEITTGYHEVQRGETLYRIASKYGLTVGELRKMNNLSKDQDIYPKQKLKVK